MPLLSKSQISKVNARHLLDDLASSYTYSVEEAVIGELIANSLDAKSSNIFVDLSKRANTLALTDDGPGMGNDAFIEYHDLAQSRKVKGTGIGFAGLGAKLGHRVSRKVVTETRSNGHRDASEWGFKGTDLQWKRIRARSLKRDGTKVTLHVTNRAQRMLSSRFVTETIKKHYGALLDPFLSQIYIWNSIYPSGITIHLNGDALPQQPLVPPANVERRHEIDIRGRGRRLIGRAVFVLAKDPLPEDQQGIAISTYGKNIRRDTLGVYPRRPEFITGWVEAPDLVECLTLNKQDFSDSGRQGEKFKRIRRQLQKPFADWLQEIGETRRPEERQRAPRRLERETAEILRSIPELRFLLGAQMRETAQTPDPSGDTTSAESQSMQPTFGLETGQGGDGDAPALPGPEEGQAPQPEPDGAIPTRPRRRTARGGPRIERVSDSEREEMSWVEGDTVFINNAHPTRELASRRGFLGYHERFAIFFALCQEAPVDADERLRLLARALTAWGRS